MTSVKFSNGQLSSSGTFTKGSPASDSSANPLLVLIHGGGVNSNYFDNAVHSIPKEFNEDGYDVLNLDRVGYKGNPIATTDAPLFDAAPLYAGFINQVYKENHGGKGGVILVGHSLGAATSIIVAAKEGKNIPLIGVSALGIIPDRTPPAIIQRAILANPDADRLPLAQPDPITYEKFLGAPKYFDLSKVDLLAPINEGAPKNELAHWLDVATHDTFVNELAPAVKVPLQYLAAEIEFQWSGIEEGQPIFDKAKSLFTGVPRIDADILPGGAHNFEFSTNASLLRERRLKFFKSLV